jgi:hypothetical protein
VPLWSSAAILPLRAAVAVTVCPTGTLAAGEKVKVALPSDPVVTLLVPMNFLPSPPEGLE